MFGLQKKTMSYSNSARNLKPVNTLNKTASVEELMERLKPASQKVVIKVNKDKIKEEMVIQESAR